MQLDGQPFKGRKLRIQVSKKPDVLKSEKSAKDKKDSSSHKPMRKHHSKASNATQGSFIGEKADKMKRLKLKKQKKIKKSKEFRKQKKMAKSLLPGDSKKEKAEGHVEKKKDKFKKGSNKTQARNRMAKVKRKREPKS